MINRCSLERGKEMSEEVGAWWEGDEEMTWVGEAWAEVMAP